MTPKELAILAAKALDERKGKEISAIETMEEYANYGFSVMEEKLKDDKGYFFGNRSFLDIFLQLTSKEESIDPQKKVLQAEAL